MDQYLAQIDAMRPVRLAVKAFVGGDKNSKHVMSRILTCPHIVEALYVTRLGLFSRHMPSQDSRFHAEGHHYKIWWEQPQQLVHILYLLHTLKLGPVSALHACFSAAPLFRTRWLRHLSTPMLRFSSG